MEYIGKNKKHYFGFWFECFLLIIVPLAFYIMFLLLFGAFFPLRKELNEISARALGFGLGSVYHASCIVVGAFEDAWGIIKFRVHNFFENLQYSPKTAFKEYLYDLTSDGIEFWVYLSILLACGILAASGILDYLEIIGLV